jgi:DNA processing protein
MERIGGRFIFLGESLYPNALAIITDPPPVIGVIGSPQIVQKLPELDMFAVVGSRACSYNSARFAYNLSKNLSSEGITIVSGLARGIDAQAHKGGLSSKGSSVAVLACGLGVPPYPPENKDLYCQLQESGMIMSEMPFNIAPQAALFPRRNRIIAGLTRGTLVVEAADKSGSLTTARYALEYNRDVYAVPGFPLDPRCVGTNRLLKNGAILVESAFDILNNYPTTVRPPLPFNNFKLEEQQGAFGSSNNEIKIDLKPDPTDKKARIFELLGSDPVSIEDLTNECQIPVNNLMAILTELELDNKVKIENNQQVSLVIC